MYIFPQHLECLIQHRSLVDMFIHLILHLLISLIVFCSPEELLVDEVLKTLVVSPKDPNRKKFKVRAARNAVMLTMFSSF